MRPDKFFFLFYPKIWPVQNFCSAVDCRFRNCIYFNGRGLKILVFCIAMDWRVVCWQFIWLNIFLRSKIAKNLKFGWNSNFLEIFGRKKLFNQINWIHTTLQSIAIQNIKILSPLPLKCMQFLNLESTAEATIYII